MAIHKFVSVKNIMNRLYRTFKQNYQVSETDIVEWIGEALDDIGAHAQYQQRVADIPIVNYRGVLPCELVHVLQISDAYGNPLFEYSGTMGSVPNEDGPNDNNTIGAQDNTMRFVPVDEDNFPLANMELAGGQRHVYYIDNDQIHTSLKEGTIRMSFIAMRLDADNYPYIPDLEEYKKAVTFYVQYMLDWQAWRAGRLADKVFAETKNQWQVYARAARGKANAPSLAQLENIKNMRLQILPRINQFSNFFNTVSLPELRRIR